MARSNANLLGHALAVALACAGAWTLAIRPLHARLEGARADLASSTRQVEDLRRRLGSNGVNFHQAIHTISEHTSLIEQRCARSGDPSQVYDALGELARSHGVRVERIEPRKVPSSAIPAAPKSARVKNSDEARGPSVDAFGYEIEATGSYADVARFVNAIERDAGMSKILAFTMSPIRDARGTPIVRASVQTAHFRLSGTFAPVALAKEPS